MEILINGVLRQVPDDIGVLQLLELLNLTGRRLALEINQEIVPRSYFATQHLHPGDRIEIVQAIGGG